MVDNTVQSLVRETAIVLSSEDDKSLDFDGKYRDVTLDA